MQVVCTAQLLGERYFTIGDTYEVEEDGSIMNDNRFVYTRERCGKTRWIISKNGIHLSQYRKATIRE